MGERMFAYILASVCFVRLWSWTPQPTPPPQSPFKSPNCLCFRELWFFKARAYHSLICCKLINYSSLFLRTSSLFCDLTSVTRSFSDMVFHNSLEELRVHEGGFAKYPKHLLCHPTLVLQNSGLSAATSSATFVALGTILTPAVATTGY